MRVSSDLRHKAIVATTLLALVAFPSSAPIDRTSSSDLSESKTASPVSAGYSASTAWVHEAYAQLPLAFEANIGQTDTQVEFLARGNSYTLFLTAGDAVLALRAPKAASELRRGPLADARATGETSATTASVLRMHMLGGNPAVRPTPELRLPGVVNYFIGNDPAQWRVGVPTFARITYRQIYPGIDLIYYGDLGRLEYDFVIAAGADPAAIALEFVGADGMRIDGLGNLVLSLPAGEIRQQKPRIYQKAGGAVSEVSGGYVVTDTGEVRFAVGAYDASRPLVIDPVIHYSTYLGGSSTDYGYATAVDAAGNAYITGVTSSVDFPTSTAPFDMTSNGGFDTFVAKLNPAGTALLYSTYLGGSGDDYGFGIAVDPAGNAYVTGHTLSANYPTSPGAFDTTFNGTSDAFVTKLNPTPATPLIYSTYLGGSGHESGNGIAADAAGYAYVAGTTYSPNFPTTTGAYDTTFNGVTDAFVTKLSPSGATPLVYSTFLGGTSFDIGQGVGIDTGGSAYVAGYTTSTNFPTTPGAFDTSLGGGQDAFVTKLNAAGSAPLAYSSYLGGSNTEYGYGVAVDAGGNAHLTGVTHSSDFPTSAGAVDTTFDGTADAFVTKLTPTAATPPTYSTYLGGSGFDTGHAIAVDAAANAYVTGFTYSVDFPMSADAFDATFNGVTDAFVTKINLAGTNLVYSTYLGGGDEDIGRGIAVDMTGSAYVTGNTRSSDFPISPGAFDTTLNNYDGFVTKIAQIGPPATLTLDPAADTNTVGTSHTVTATVNDASGKPVVGTPVRFTVTGSVTASGSCTTDANGRCSFTYQGPELPGEDTITAFADTNGDGDQDLGEPSGGATKTWTVPAGTELCEVIVTDAGRITAANGDKAKFHGVASSDADGNASGNQVYEDLGPAQPFEVESTRILAVTCSGDRTTATIFGEATIDGSGSFQFRIRVTDNGGSPRDDIYGIILSNGYASGDRILDSGNVQIR